MSKAMICAAVLAAGTPAFAAAQTGKPPPADFVAPARPLLPPPVVATEPDPAALAEARGLMHDLDFEAQMVRTAREAGERTFATMMREIPARSGEQIPAELRERVRAVLMQNVARVIDEMRPTALEDAARIYARYFTADELREIRRVQTNPVMMKMQRLSPQLLAELMQIGIAASARHMPEVTAQVQRVIAQWRREHEGRGNAS